MTFIKLTKRVKGLPYPVGALVPVYPGRHGYVWHVWKTIICIPWDAYRELVEH